MWIGTEQLAQTGGGTMVRSPRTITVIRGRLKVLTDHRDCCLYLGTRPVRCGRRRKLTVTHSLILQDVKELLLVLCMAFIQVEVETRTLE